MVTEPNSNNKGQKIPLTDYILLLYHSLQPIRRQKMYSKQLNAPKSYTIITIYELLATF